MLPLSNEDNEQKGDYGTAHRGHRRLEESAGSFLFRMARTAAGGGDGSL